MTSDAAKEVLAQEKESNQVIKVYADIDLPTLSIWMSPVSPVFHTEATVRIVLKTYSEWEHPFHNIIL